MISIDVTRGEEAVDIEVVGHSSRGPIGLSRIVLDPEDAIVLRLSEAQAVALVSRLARSLERRIK